jgi:hypothetical protein
MVMVAAADQWAYGGRPVDWAFLFSQNSLSRSITANDIGVSWGQLMALGKELFAGKIVPSPPFAENFLGKACAKRKDPSAVSIWLTAQAQFPVVH